MKHVATRRSFLLLATLCLVLLLASCATTTTARPPEIPAMHSVNEIHDEYLARSPDPWAGFNRSMYRFNYNLDKYLLLPVVNSYEFITPIFVRDRISGFFGNLQEARNLTNSLFQLKMRQSLKTLGRFVVNSSLGVGGLFDPATNMGMKKRDEDFGQTLGYWGVESGGYLVLPLLGPSNMRDTGGLMVDTGIRLAIVSAIAPFESVNNGKVIEAGITTLEGIDKRHLEKFRYHDSNYPFEYEMIRYLYGKQRELQIMK